MYQEQTILNKNITVDYLLSPSEASELVRVLGVAEKIEKDLGVNFGDIAIGVGSMGAYDGVLYIDEGILARPENEQVLQGKLAHEAGRILTEDLCHAHHHMDALYQAVEFVRHYQEFGRDTSMPFRKEVYLLNAFINLTQAEKILAQFSTLLDIIPRLEEESWFRPGGYHELADLISSAHAPHILHDIVGLKIPELYATTPFTSLESAYDEYSSVEMGCGRQPVAFDYFKISPEKMHYYTNPDYVLPRDDAKRQELLDSIARLEEKYIRPILGKTDGFTREESVLIGKAIEFVCDEVAVRYNKNTIYLERCLKKEMAQGVEDLYEHPTHQERLERLGKMSRAFVRPLKRWIEQVKHCLSDDDFAEVDEM